jgi:hypothetical protein
VMMRCCIRFVNYAYERFLIKVLSFIFLHFGPNGRIGVITLCFQMRSCCEYHSWTTFVYTRRQGKD